MVLYMFVYIVALFLPKESTSITLGNSRSSSSDQSLSLFKLNKHNLGELYMKIYITIALHSEPKAFNCSVIAYGHPAN